MASVEEQKEWKKFRQALDKSDRKAFHDMFSISHMPNSAYISPTRIYTKVIVGNDVKWNQ